MLVMSDILASRELLRLHRKGKNNTNWFAEWLVQEARDPTLPRESCPQELLIRPQNNKHILEKENYLQVAQWITSHGAPIEIPWVHAQELQLAIDARQRVNRYYVEMHGGPTENDKRHEEFINMLEDIRDLLL